MTPAVELAAAIRALEDLSERAAAAYETEPAAAQAEDRDHMDGYLAALEDAVAALRRLGEAA